jgi:hypothetical protein
MTMFDDSAGFHVELLSELERYWPLPRGRGGAPGLAVPATMVRAMKPVYTWTFGDLRFGQRKRSRKPEAGREVTAVVSDGDPLVVPKCVPFSRPTQGVWPVGDAEDSASVNARCVPGETLCSSGERSSRISYQASRHWSRWPKNRSAAVP